METSKKATVKRWIDIFGLSLVVFLLYLAIDSLIGKLSDWAGNSVLKWGIFVNLLIVIFSVAATWILLWRLGATHFGWQDKSRIRTFVKWPPVWLSVVLSLYCLSFLTNYTFVQITKISAIFLAGLPIGFIIRLVNRWLTKDKNDDQQQSQIIESFHEISKDWEKLKEWLYKEDAITEPTQDRFDMAVQARNISRVLLAKQLKTVVLVGEYGSGKSSILNMVDYYLEPKNRKELNQDDAVDQKINVITCMVSGWGFAKGSTAEHILECAINKLSEYVDVSGLRIVPEQYAAALGSASNVFLKILAALATCWKSPLGILKRIDEVLTAINSRLIIFLEDVDRNKSDEMFFNEIAALLDNLRGLERISFVLAIGQEYDKEEVLIKTAEHVENVPRLNRFDVLKTLESFRTHCIALCPDIISTIPKEFKRDRIGWDRSEMIQAVAGISDDLSKPIDAIVELTSNPRVLKHALRRTLTVWEKEKLAGEIDFNDLLIVNVLKVVDERVFSFIDKNIGRLCALVANNKKEREVELRKKLEPEYKRAIVGDEYNVNAVSELVDALFPGFVGSNTVEWSLRRDLTSYQHVANNEPTKYWERIKRGELYYNEIADREILKALTQWNEDFESTIFKGMEMIKALSTDKRVLEKANQFKKLISRDCLQKAASKQFDKTLEKYGNKASCEVCDAADSWYMLKPESFDSQWHQWLLNEVKKALLVSLPYVNDLYKYWYNPKYNPDGDLRAQVVEAAKELFEDDPALLAKTLDIDHMWSVWHFAGLYSQTGWGGNGFKPEEWKWLGEVLTKAGAVDPQTIGVHIAALVCNCNLTSSHRAEGWKATFEAKRVKQIFDGNMDAIMKLLQLEGVDIEKYDGQSKAVLLFVRDKAKKWLKQNQGGEEESGRS